jgi:probable rRNA maturation factor
VTTAGPEVAVDAAVDAPGWEAIADPGALAADAARAAAAEAAALRPALAGRSFEVSVLFADDARIAELNGRFRDRPGPTNVLSWPAWSLAPATAGEPPPPPPADGPSGVPCFLGDIALAAGVTAREAAERGLAFRAHAAHLIAHATLHLFGYDHDTDADAETMESAERRALARIGVKDPYTALDAG